MYEIIYIKADYEPWWMFDDWEQMVQTRKAFDNIVEAKAYLDELNALFINKFTCFEMRKNKFFAYWSPQERIFCEGCDDNLQIFHGIISFQDGNPTSLVLDNNSNI